MPLPAFRLPTVRPRARRPRFVCTGLVAALASGLALTTLTAGSAAHAASSRGFYLPAVSSLVVDSATPLESTPGGGTVVLGTQVAGSERHLRRLYVTLDLKPLAGSSVDYANIVLPVTDDACDATALTVRVTSQNPQAPTWAKGRRAVAEAGAAGFYAECGGERWVRITASVASAVAAGRTSLPLLVAVSEDSEADPSAALPVITDRIRLVVSATPPLPVPRGAFLYKNWCPKGGTVAASPNIGFVLPRQDDGPLIAGGEISVRRTDVAEDPITLYAGPRQRWLEADLPGGYQVDGASYEARARVVDGDLTGGWSEPCRWSVDAAAPEPPTISSPDVTEGGTAPSGRKTTFTFTDSSTDVAGYRWEWVSQLYGGGVWGVCHTTANGLASCTDILANSDVAVRGQSATVALVPRSDGPGYEPATLSVRAVDVHGNWSQPTEFSMQQSVDAPEVIVPEEMIKPGATYPLRVTPAPVVGDVVAYVVAIDGGGTKRYPATSPTGTTTLKLPFPKNSYFRIGKVWSVAADGWTSTPTDFTVFGEFPEDW